MNKTKIEYLDASWNPIAMRCTPVSEGCANCWHLAMANRLAGNQMFPPKVRDAYAGKGQPILMRHRLDEPLRRKKPATIGVQFMGDLFHEDVPFEFIEQVYGIMAEAKHHTFQVLTKQPKRAAEFLLNCILPSPRYLNVADVPLIWKNVWLGTSIENQAAADERREYLRQCPAAVKFVSYEPALSPVDWTGWEFVSQIISGGESGPGARPSHPEWHRATRDFCQTNGIAYFYKQHGAWLHESQISEGTWGTGLSSKFVWPNETVSYRVGKRAAGRLLDRQEHDEMPRRKA